MMMMKGPVNRALVKGVALSLALLGLAGAKERSAKPVVLPLTFVKAPPPSGGGSQRSALSEEPPSGKYKMPQFKAAKPLYATIKLGEKEYLAVADFFSKTECRVYIDSNGNGNLTDDKSVIGKLAKRKRKSKADIWEFNPVELKAEIKGKPVPYYVVPKLYGYALIDKVDMSTTETIPRGLSFSVASGCHFTATYKLGSQSVEMFVVDRNANGTFDDLPKEVTQPGRTIGKRKLPARTYTVPGDQTHVRRHGRAASFSTIGSYIVIGDRLFKTKIDVPTKRLGLIPVSRDVGYLNVPFEAETITLKGEVAILGINVKGKMPVPAGKYTLGSYCRYKMQDKELWKLVGAADRSFKEVEVPLGKTVDWKIGDAYVHAPKYPPRAYKGKISFSYGAKGAGGENITVARGITSGRPYGRRLPPPTYTVTSNGKQIAAGKFKYG